VQGDFLAVAFRTQKAKLVTLDRYQNRAADLLRLLGAQPGSLIAAGLFL